MNRRSFLHQTGAALAASGLFSQSYAESIVLQSAWATNNIGDIGHTPGTLHVLEA